jgi:predicted ATP-grasp superfamily ATP-dependent carboligase
LPVEVNPRYTASIEVLEYATAVAALALHRAVFDADGRGRPAPKPSILSTQYSVLGTPSYVGKAILFARQAVTIPGDGPWSLVLKHPVPVDQVPLFADVPRDGQRIRAGSPILTFFARADSVAGCIDTLKQIAADLDRWLLGR